MPIPGGTYLPRAEWWFRRSYVAGLDFRFNPVTSFGLVGDTYAFLSVPDNVFVAVTVDTRIQPFSSNSYSLDFPITSSIYRTPPTGPDNLLPFTLEPVSDPVDGGIWLEFRPFGIVGSQHYRFPWAIAPPTYWLQPWWT